MEPLRRPWGPNHDLGLRTAQWRPLHSSRRDPEPSVRQELIGYVGFAAGISTTPPSALGRELQFAACES